MITLGIVTFIILVVVFIPLYQVQKHVVRLEKRAVRTDNDINTLQYNQNVLVSTLREINRELRKHEKSSQIFKRKIRRPFQEEEKSDERDT